MSSSGSPSTRSAAPPPPSPRVCIYLLEALRLLHQTLRSAGLGDRGEALVEQARLIAKGALLPSDLLAEDIESVQTAYAKRFTPEQRALR